MIALLVLLVAWAALVATWIAAIVSASATPDTAFAAVGRSRGGTIVLIVLTGWLGAIYYWLAIKRDLQAAASN